MFVRRLLPVLVAVAMGVAGCGDESSEGGGPEEGPGVRDPTFSGAEDTVAGTGGGGFGQATGTGTGTTPADTGGTGGTTGAPGAPPMRP